MTTGQNTYEPYWQHCVWSKDGIIWNRIPERAQKFGDGELIVETSMEAGAGVWLAIIFPLPFSWYQNLCLECSQPVVPNARWRIDKRKIGDSMQSRPLYAFEIKNRDAKAKRNLLVVAGQHAVEQSGKMLAEDLLRGYHSGRFAGSRMERLLQTHNVVVVPLANPDGCYDGRMNSNAEGVVMGNATDQSVETRALLALIDELRPHVLINCHGWGNEIGIAPYEDTYRFTDHDPLFVHLKKRVPGCSSSGTPHYFEDNFRLESHAHDNYETQCAIVEINYHWFVPPNGSAPRQPTREDIRSGIEEYLTAIADFCIEDTAR